MLSFVHTSDLHLDSPFVGLADMDEGVADMVRRSTFQAYENVIQLCLDESVDFLLVAGDIYDGADRSLKAQLAFRNGLERLSGKGIRSFIVHGNHDPLDGWASTLEWPEGVHIFGGTRVESIPYRRNGAVQCVVHGISFAHRQVRTNLARKFQLSSLSVPQIGLLHCNVGSVTGHEPYAPCRLAELRREMTYWALGHVHTRDILNREQPTVVYPGNPQGLNVNESGERGCMLASISDRQEVDVRFVPVDAVRWGKASIQIDALDSEDALLSAIEHRIGKVQEESGGRPSICRMTLSGRGPLHGNLQKTHYLEDMLGHCRDIGRDLSPLVWVDKIERRTRPPVDVEQRRRSQDFVGDLLRITAEYRKDGRRLDRLREAVSPLYEHRRCRKWLAMMDDEALVSLLEEAEIECLDRLTEEDSP